ncbi:MAG TPA: iron-containing redox enzyme family protein [Acidimicrobiales bacterium]|nr:iron-containing redox enzyme family protein [Acidimicrobiales bacterium]
MSETQPVPEPRGELTEALIDVLGSTPGSPVPRPPAEGADPMLDDDLQLGLYLCYELHYRGVEGADPAWEWDPGLLGLRRTLETRFEERLRELTAPDSWPDDVIGELRRLSSVEDGPSLSEYVETKATLEQFRELCIHRSGWQLKEADPHSWAIMRITGVPKAVLVGLQYDEYGAGEPRDVHSTLFAESMRMVGLDERYGAYVDRMPAITLATVNLVSMLGLHRRLLPAVIGHLTLFETTSVGPMSRYSRALARLGFDADARRFFDVHVAADTRHGEIALEKLVGGLLETDPTSGRGILFGAWALNDVEARFTDHVLGCWEAGVSSLR